MKKICLLLLITSRVWAGDEHGTGDYLRLLFEQGRLNAMGVIERVKLENLPTYLQKYLKPDEYTWLLAHKEELVRDIAQSRHLWENALPAYCNKYDTCACTENMKDGADILFSYKTCGDKAKDRQEAGSLLIHEAVHHLLGADEDRADRIATVFYVAWSAMGHSEMLECRPVPVADTTLYVPHWNGSELVVFHTEKKVGFFNPQLNTWRYESPQNPVIRLKQEAWDAYRVFYTKEAAVFSHPRLPSSGAIYYFKQNRWEEFAKSGRPKWIMVPPAEKGPVPPMPDYEGQEQAQIVGDYLVVWQNLQTQAVDPYRGTYRYFQGAPGAILHIPSNTWTPMKDHPVLSTRWGQEHASNTHQLFVLGGFGYDAMKKKYDFFSGGAFYDLSTKQWSGISDLGSPALEIGKHQESTSLLWGSDRLIAFSALGTFNKYYDPRLDRWTVAASLFAESSTADRSANFYEPRLPLGATWTGTHLLLVGDSLYFLNPAQDRWLFRKDVFLRGDKYIQRSPKIQPIWTETELFLWDGRRLCSLYL